jgi:signal transduction histidine kinase
MIQNVETDLVGRIKETRAIINYSNESFLIFSHKAYIYSIFLNLIGNSIKYRSDLRPNINISIRSDADTTVIRFSDNGLGIDLARNGEDLFKPYKRFHPDIEGKGLGLFLVKSHVEALHGNISIDSKPGNGTTFTITLPQS